MKAIDINQLVKTYRSGLRKTSLALDGVSLQIEQGESFGFVGPNGAGKSTTIKIMTGVLRANSGSAKLFGIDSQSHQARKGIGYVAESPYLYDYLTPIEVLKLSLDMHGVRLDRPKAECMKWLEIFGLAHVATKIIRQFSKGMIQRTALASALVIKPKMLILDEPLSGLDPIGRREVVDLLDNYRRGGGTLFFSSHVLYDVERLADRFGLIFNGKLVSTQKPADLLHHDTHELIIEYQGKARNGALQLPDQIWQAKVKQQDLWEYIQSFDRQTEKIICIKPSQTKLENVFFDFAQTSQSTEI